MVKKGETCKKAGEVRRRVITRGLVWVPWLS